MSSGNMSEKSLMKSFSITAFKVPAEGRKLPKNVGGFRYAQRHVGVIRGVRHFTAIAIGAAPVYPSMSQIMQGEVLYDVLSGTIFESPIYIEFAGMPVILMNYASGVIPIILAISVLHAVDHDSVDAVGCRTDRNLGR